MVSESPFHSEPEQTKTLLSAMQMHSGWRLIKGMHFQVGGKTIYAKAVNECLDNVAFVSTLFTAEED